MNGRFGGIVMVLAALVGTTAMATDLLGLPRGGAAVSFDDGPLTPFWFGVDQPESAITTFSIGSTFDVNALLGADAYYGHSTPITGQNAIATNLEAGHIWNGQETLAHVVNFTNSSDTWGGGGVAPLYDRHATWVAMFIGGRETLDGGIFQKGIAPGASLRSAAIATSWISPAYALSFNISSRSYIAALGGSFGVADVINSSYSYGDAAGTSANTVFSDGLAWNSPTTTYVVSAGNTSSAGSVGGPGSGYNTITVGGLGNANAFDTVASFSSRGPQDFGYYNTPSSTVVVPGVRAVIDIAAPGVSLVSGFYGGQTGGNNTALFGSANSGTFADAYSEGIAGTSFAAPLVAGGVALVTSAAKTLPELSGNPAAALSPVVKSLLLGGAAKTIGWNNGQTAVTVGGTSYIRTTQSLDWAAGAGRMDLEKTFQLQIGGQIDVSGTAQGLLGQVQALGWDYGAARVGVNNDYILTGTVAAGSTLDATLSWLRTRESIILSATTADLLEIAQANLNLSVWALDESNAFTSLVARSESLYNVVEHLSFAVPAAGRYGLRIEYPFNTFDNTDGGVWGSAAFPQDYGLSWNAVVVPEPQALALAAGGVAAVGAVSRRRRRRPG